QHGLCAGSQHDRRGKLRKEQAGGSRRKGFGGSGQGRGGSFARRGGFVLDSSNARKNPLLERLRSLVDPRGMFCATGRRPVTRGLYTFSEEIDREGNKTLPLWRLVVPK